MVLMMLGKLRSPAFGRACTSLRAYSGSLEWGVLSSKPESSAVLEVMSWTPDAIFIVVRVTTFTRCQPTIACKRTRSPSLPVLDVHMLDIKSSPDSDELSGEGLVVGCYETKQGSGTAFELTKCAEDLDLKTHGKLLHLINVSGGKLRKGASRLFYDLSPDHTHVAVVGLGPSAADISAKEGDAEGIDIAAQNVREAAAIGTRVLQGAKVKSVLLDDFNNAEACAEGSTLSLFSYDKLKSPKKRSKIPDTGLISTNPSHLDRWARGCVIGSAQNFARELMETPSNHMTPTMFVEAVSNKVGQVRSSLSNPNAIQVIPRPLSWIESQKMGAFLGIARGSTEVPWLLEMRLNMPEGEGHEEGPDGKGPIALVGKGVTFDTGGISIKPSSGMGMMRGDMGGAACVVSSMLALAKLGYPGKVVGLTPLCENMPSGNAVKPGDVVTAMNGKSIEVDNTDAEGRLLLADALCYASTFKPRFTLDLATLTGAIAVALGSGAAAVFTNSAVLWEELQRAGHKTGDRLWRMPLYQQYSKQIESHFADVSNVGTRDRMAGACTAAAFLKEFIAVDHWAHLDIAGVMDGTGGVAYLGKGMTGRPTRTVIQYVEQS